ncbi:hypothetical protein FACS1894110_11360 [Spirochaetia bacterium]|nr:hypothetical protein FACS1894110_11360 [Spirochaetia bacterium]
MKKKSLVVGTIALLLTAVVFLGCPGAGETGPAGPQGPGGSGTDGYAPAALLSTATALFNANVDKVYLIGADAGTGGVTAIPSGKTLLIPSASALTGSGAGIKVESGGTLLISGTLTPDAGDIVVESGGTLTVLKGGNLVANNTKDLQVKAGANVTIKNGGTLTSTTDLNVAATASTSIIAKEIGGLTKTNTGADAFGTITFESDAWLAVPPADIVATNRGWVAHNQLAAVGAVTTAVAFPAGTGYKLKINASSTAIETPTTVPVGNELIIGALSGASNALAAGVTVNGKLTIEPGATLATASGYNLTVVGTAQAGDIVITGAATGVATTTAAAVKLGVASTGIGTLSFGINDVIAIPTGASIVVGGADGISLGEGDYKSLVAASSITGIADGGATLAMVANAVFTVGSGSGATTKGYLTVGNKSGATFASAGSGIFTASTVAGNAKVYFKQGANLGGDNTDGIKLTDGTYANVGVGILPAGAGMSAAGVLAADFKLASTLSGPLWAAGTF